MRMRTRSPSFATSGAHDPMRCDVGTGRQCRAHRPKEPVPHLKEPKRRHLKGAGWCCPIEHRLTAERQAIFYRPCVTNAVDEPIKLRLHVRNNSHLEFRGLKLSSDLVVKLREVSEGSLPRDGAALVGILVFSGLCS